MGLDANTERERISNEEQDERHGTREAAPAGLHDGSRAEEREEAHGPYDQRRVHHHVASDGSSPVKIEREKIPPTYTVNFIGVTRLTNDIYIDHLGRVHFFFEDTKLIAENWSREGNIFNVTAGMFTDRQNALTWKTEDQQS